MKIGVYFSELEEGDGGVYTFERDIFRALVEAKTNHEIVIINASNSSPKIPPDFAHKILNFSGSGNTFGRTLGRVFKPWQSIGQQLNITPRPFNRYWPLQRLVNKNQIELMWFLTGYKYVEVPYVLTVLDLQHRLQPAFPEINIYGWKWNMRERLYYTGLKRCALSVAGTERGCEEIMRFYGLNPERVKSIALPTPSFVLDASASTIKAPLPEGIKQPYLFYPAQFWPHKNHIVLLKMLKILKEQHELNFSLVFTGSDKGNLSYVKESAKNLGLQENVKFFGFVDQGLLVTLYQNAFALVYPSLFGPDNFPSLEAFALACPVVAGNVPGAEEQLGENALLVNNLKEEEFADAVKKLWDEPGLRHRLIEKGRIRARSWTARDYVNKMFTIVDEFAPIRRCWGSNGS